MRRLVLPLAALLAAVLQSTAPAAPPKLGHEGRWITDGRGRVVILHGWNLVSKVGSYRPEDTGFGRDDARFLRRNGFNTIRLGVIYKALEPNPPGADGKPRYRDGYLRSIARTQRLLARFGIHTLLDFHQDLYNERFQGEGWPDWQTLDDGVPSAPQVGFPGNYVVNLGLNRAFDNFWANTPVAGAGLQDRYAAAWRHVARRFRREPGLLGYNIINEPWPGSVYATCISLTGCALFDTQTLEPFSERVIGRIREVDRRTLAWYTPAVVFDFGADSNHGDTGDPRAGFAYNMYCLAGGFLPANPAGDLSCSATYEITLDNADKQADQTGDALLMTEWGATNDLAVIDEVAELADQHRMSWQQWHYCECDDPTTAGTGVQSVVIDPPEAAARQERQPGQASDERAPLSAGRLRHAARLGLRPRNAALRPELLDDHPGGPAPRPAVADPRLFASDPLPARLPPEAGGRPARVPEERAGPEAAPRPPCGQGDRRRHPPVTPGRV